MSARPDVATEQEHTAPVSDTPTAWITLSLVMFLLLGWIFLDPIACGAMRLGLTAVSWWRGDELRIEHLGTGAPGWIEARGVEFLHGRGDHRSSWKSDEIRLRMEPLTKILFPGKNHPRRLIQALQMRNSRVLIDRRVAAESARRHVSKDSPGSAWTAGGAAWNFLPASCLASTVNLVVIGDNYRIAVTGLNLRLPERWTGRISYNAVEADLGTWHRVFPKASAVAVLDGNELRIGALDLGKQMALRELTLSPHEGGIQFGLRAMAGNGQVRGDGIIGSRGNTRHLDITLVGESLNLASFNEVMAKGRGASGTISQARLTFRGNTTHLMDAESSLRLIARDIHWQGLDWESLRIAATMTGRNLNLSELTLQQQGNEVVAEGRSQLPSDWRQALKSPFTARFHADLEDARTLTSLGGSPFAQISGAFYLEGEMQGSDNKAQGYCNVTGRGLKVRDLPLDWVKGCLLFEGDKTRLSNLEAQSGEDRVYLEGVVANSRPHDYQGHAEFGIHNLTKRLTQLGYSTAPAIGSGGVKGSWQGNGSMESHSGAFQMDVTEWVSRWTTTGMTGRFEGAYAPGKLDISKAVARQDNLNLSWKMAATPQKLEVSSILATKEGKNKPLVEGSLVLPVDALDLWQSGNPIRTLGMKGPMAVNLALHGVDAGELAEALGQKAAFAGTLEGNVTVSGTPATPEIHTALRVGHFELPIGTPENDLSVTLEATNGQLSATLQEDPATNSPLTLSLQIPVTLTSDQGILALAQGAAEVRGDARFRLTALDGWASVLAGNSYPLHNARLDGKVTLSGTLQKPDVHGTLTLSAAEARLFRAQSLKSLSLPMVLTNTSVTISNGSASYGEQPVALLGSLDCIGGVLSGSVHLTGTNLPVEMVPGLKTTCQADLLLKMNGTNAPKFGGTIQLTSLESRWSASLTPFFGPPGIATAAVFPAAAEPSVPTPFQVDLAIKTPGTLPVAPSPQTSLSADLHLRGSAALPRVEGAIEVDNATIDLPPGKFFVPKASLQFDGEHGVAIDVGAFGFTRRGLSSLRIAGSAVQPTLSFQAIPEANAPDVIRLLSMPPSGARKAGYLFQSGAWLRQQMLLPMPAADWATSRLGTNAPEALGFYGSPWASNWEFLLTKTAKEISNN
jgi:hypothetical protein